MDNELRKNLADLGLDVASNEFLVFRALLQAAGGIGRSITFSEMVPVLEDLAERSFTKAYLYRCLNSLEERNMISIDSVQHPRRYSISETKLNQTIMNLKESRRKLLHETKKKIAEQINLLETINPQEIALVITEALAESASPDRSIMIEGIENVRSTVIREFAESAQEGDMVRVLAYMETIREGLGPGGMAELSIMQSALRGVRVRGLMIPSGSEEEDVKLILGFMENLKDAFQNAGVSGNMEIKLGAEQARTYRMVSLNDDKMLLYFTHAKESDVAALVQRKDNPGLVDDAIATFDRLWVDGRDLLAEISQKVDSVSQH